MLSHRKYNQLGRSFALCSLLLGLLLVPALAQEEAAEGGDGPDAASVEKGEVVFNANCTQCHAFNQKLVGPAMKNAHERWDTRENLFQFIKYPQRVIESGHPHAVALYEEYKQFMPNHDFLEDDEIYAVIDYIEAKSAEAPAQAQAGGAAAEGGGGQVAAGGGAGVGSEFMTIILIGLLVVLLLVLLVLVLLISVLAKFLKSQDVTQEERATAQQRLDVGKIFKSNVFRGTVTAILVVVLVKVGFDQVYAVGVQQGYAPKQPIAFSHKLHAGMYEINCAYCHTSVYKAKSANIPSANICMNCHNQIKTESPEIKKIWAAVENNRPIEWIRVHNLPDLAYFNHSQHTKVGGLACQTCHGAIEEMEVVKHHSSLTMGWCINCHRQTVVKAEGNAYYNKLIELHQESNGKEPMHVADIGGLECSKCHY